MSCFVPCIFYFRSRRNKSSDDLAALALRRSTALAASNIACSLPVEFAIGHGGRGALPNPPNPPPTVVVSVCSSKESSARSQIPPLPEIPEEHLES